MTSSSELPPPSAGLSQRQPSSAIDGLWGYTHEMFDLDALESELAAAGIGVDNSSLRAEWEKQIGAILAEADLKVPDEEWAVRGGRVGYHTEYLGQLLNEMQSVHRANPGLEW